MKHKTCKVTLEFDVDEGVAAMVEWLNSLHWVRTLDSCEGYGDQRKWVTFVCLTEKSLATIKATAKAMSGEVSHDKVMGTIRYMLKWDWRLTW